MTTPRQRVPGLDAVRGVALVAVVAYHLGYLRGGFLGVDMFFVLSGFLVTGLALAEVGDTGTLGLRAFWGRRFRRLAPALLVMVPVTVTAALLLGWPTDERGDLAIDGFATLTWWANWRQIIAPGGGYWSEVPSLFRHAWSLAIEEQFYVLWPLVLTGCIALAARGRRHARLVVGVVSATLATASAIWSVVLAHRIPDSDLSRVYLGSDTRAVAPLLGCALATVWWGRRAGRGTQILGWVASVGLGVLIVTTDVSAASTYRVPLLSLTAVLSAVTIVGATGWRRIDPVSAWIGRRSYGLYLWSWPIQVLIQLWRPLAGRDKVALATVVASVIAAEISWQIVEHPAQRRRWWATHARPRRLAGIGALGVVAVVGSAAVATATPKAPHETMTDQEMAEAVLAPPPPVAPDTAPPDTRAGAGTVPPLDPSAEGERVMVVGDSVAFSYARYADEIGPIDGVATIDNRGVPFCGVLSHLTVDPGICERVDAALEIGFTGAPDVLLWIPGAWEWAGWDLPEGRVDARTTAMATALQDQMLDVSRRGAEVGARTVILEWSCPGPEDKEWRTDPDYIEWINRVIADTVEAGRTEGLDIELGQPPPAVCTGGAGGEATEAKNRAAKNEVHAADADGARWIWQNWLGPILDQTR